MRRRLVSIIIVNWNGKNDLKDCLDSLKTQKEKNIEIIVVDNASSDKSVDFIKKNYPGVKLLINKKNLGYAAGNNIGFKKSTGELILFLNNDTKVKPDFLVNLIKGIKKDVHVGGVQSKILLMDDKTKLDSIGAFFTTTGFLYHFGFRKKDTSKLNKNIDLFSAKGACMLFKRSVLEKVLLNGEIFESDYFAYFEETDLCHRVLLAGYKIRYEPSSVIFHKVGATSKRLDNSFIQYSSFKNRINTYLKNLGTNNLIKVLPVHIILCLLASLSFVLKGRIKVGLAVIFSLIGVLLNLPKTIVTRKYVQEKIRKVEDNSFLPALTKEVGLSYFIAHFRGLEHYED